MLKSYEVFLFDKSAIESWAAILKHMGLFLTVHLSWLFGETFISRIMRVWTWDIFRLGGKNKIVE